MEDVIWELEMRTPIEETATSEALLGRWALVYASEDATRSSPFFWAFRCVGGEARLARPATAVLLFSCVCVCFFAGGERGAKHVLVV